VLTTKVSDIKQQKDKAREQKQLHSKGGKSRAFLRSKESCWQVFCMELREAGVVRHWNGTHQNLRREAEDALGTSRKSFEPSKGWGCGVCPWAKPKLNRRGTTTFCTHGGGGKMERVPELEEKEGWYLGLAWEQGQNLTRDQQKSNGYLQMERRNKRGNICGVLE